MTLDQVLRKYMAERHDHIKLDPDFKLYIDEDGDIVYINDWEKYPSYIYTGGNLLDLVQFILDEAGVK